MRLVEESQPKEGSCGSSCKRGSERSSASAFLRSRRGWSDDHGGRSCRWLFASRRPRSGLTVGAEARACAIRSSRPRRSSHGEPAHTSSLRRCPRTGTTCTGWALARRWTRLRSRRPGSRALSGWGRRGSGSRLVRAGCIRSEGGRTACLAPRRRRRRPWTHEPDGVGNDGEPRAPCRTARSGLIARPRPRDLWTRTGRRSAAVAHEEAPDPAAGSDYENGVAIGGLERVEGCDCRQTRHWCRSHCL